MNKSRRFGVLSKIFGDYLKVRIFDVLLKEYLESEILKDDEIGIKEGWENISSISRKAGVSKSGAKSVLDELLKKNFIIEKEYLTHAQNPPRYFRLNENHPVIKELIFFYMKVRGFL